MSDAAARILVVDDLPENVRLLEAVLEANGYDVISATDGRGALELARSADPSSTATPFADSSVSRRRPRSCR